VHSRPLIDIDQFSRPAVTMHTMDSLPKMYRRRSIDSQPPDQEPSRSIPSNSEQSPLLLPQNDRPAVQQYTLYRGGKELRSQAYDLCKITNNGHQRDSMCSTKDQQRTRKNGSPEQSKAGRVRHDLPLSYWYILHLTVSRAYEKHPDTPHLNLLVPDPVEHF
jgi:hypothetical protein